MPKIGFQGYCGVKCMPEEMQGLEKFKKSNVSDRNAAYRSNLSRKVHSIQNGKIDTLGAEIELKCELEQWFLNIEREIRQNPYCSECGGFIPEKIKMIGTKHFINGYRCATAHIFPKSIFKSVSIHHMNFLILGAGCGCHEKTHRLDTFSDMKVFGEAVKKFRIFHKYITEKHKYLDTFLNYANGTF